MADDDFDSGWRDSFTGERTMGEQRMASRMSGSQGGSSGSSQGKSLGSSLMRGSSKLFGGVGAVVGGGVTAIAGGVSSVASKVSNAPPPPPPPSTSQAADANGGYQSSVPSSETSPPGGNAGYPTQPNPPQPNPSSASSTATGALTSVLKGGTKAVGLLATGVKSGVSAASSMVISGPGSAAGEPSAAIALGLVSACVELMVAAVPACGAENPQMELASHIDATVGSRQLNDLSARLLDFWYVLRPDSLSSWSNLHQQQWVWTTYALKYGHLGAASRPMARSMCGLLLELAAGFRPTILTWQDAQADAWATRLRSMAQMAEESPPPAGWGFPGLVIARNAPGCDLEFGQTGYSIARSDTRGLSKAHGQEMLMALKSGGIFCGGGQRMLVDADARSYGPKDFIGDPKALASQAGGSKLTEMCDEKCARLFTQKTQPIHLHNQASTQLKACLFSEGDRAFLVPVGGLGGPCVTTLDPNCRAQMRPPGKAERFQLKVLAPGLVEKSLYYIDVMRGQSVQLRGHDASTDRK